MTQCAIVKYITEEPVDSMVKINMDAVITEFKTRLAYEKRCFKSMSKHEQREVRSERKVFNQYVEQVIVDWRATKAGQDGWPFRRINDSDTNKVSLSENPHESLARV